MSLFLNQAQVRPDAPGYLKLLWFTHWYVCVCVCLSVCLFVCLSAPKGINNQWRDMLWYMPCTIGYNKFHSFSLLLIIWHLLLIKWIGVAILIQHVVNACQRKLRWRGTIATKGLPKRQSTSFIKVSRQMHSDTFERRPAFSFTVIIST